MDSQEWCEFSDEEIAVFLGLGEFRAEGEVGQINDVVEVEEVVIVVAVGSVVHLPEV